MRSSQYNGTTTEAHATDVDGDRHKNWPTSDDVGHTWECDRNLVRRGVVTNAKKLRSQRSYYAESRRPGSPSFDYGVFECMKLPQILQH